MRKVLVLSPHFDDAVLSAGQFLAGRPDADVVTIFGGEPIGDVSTPYDTKLGFRNAKDAISVRRQEDIEAVTLLRGNAIHWDYLDEQYHEPRQDTAVALQILDTIEAGDYEFILAPLGLGHPDHHMVAEALLRITHKVKTPIYLWEDIPLRVVEPELVESRLRKLKVDTRAYPGTGPMADKMRALMCYHSQIGTGILDPYVLYVPERFWKLQ